MLTNAMFFGAGDVPGNRKIVYLGNFKLNLTGIIIGIQSSIIVIPPSIIVIEIFRRLRPPKPKNKGLASSDTNELSEPGDDDSMSSVSFEDQVEKKPKKKQPFMLPNPFKYIAYFLVFACSASSALVCFFYSMMWGPRKSNEWLASMFTGFFQSILVIQPIKAVFVAILLAAIFRTPVKQEQQEEEENEEKEREENAQKEVEDRIGNDGLVDADEVPIIR